MRLWQAIKSDMLFQFKQGFYFVYVIVAAMYLVLLAFLPPEIFRIATPLVVFSDPSVLGLFFIGGIILLEKGQGVLTVLVVSPLKTEEYILAKVISLGFLSVLAAVAITFFSGYGQVNWLLLVISTFLTSAVFTFSGIMINAGCNTVNQYLLKTIPWMLLLILPCFSLMGFPGSWLFAVIPSVAALRLMLGSFLGIAWVEAAGLMLYLLIANYLLLKWTVRIFENKIIYQD
jgi:fluoroquinolone transport system permease protein